MFSPSLTSPIQSLSSLSFISTNNNFLQTNFSNLSLTTSSPPFRTTPIRMGGGPRTFPGGVSKWQWKRMQAKKSKQLLKARLARERQIYEMRKRAELKASLSELERPWEVVEKAPTLFSVKADDQLKVLADRFQKPGGFDMWGEEDGPELFKNEGRGKTSRFFPKGVVHSVKPYGKIEGIDCRSEDGLIDWRSVMSGGGDGSGLRAKRMDERVVDGESGENRLRGNVFKKRRDRRRYLNGSEEMSSREGVLEEGNGRRDFGEVYDKTEYRRLDSLNGLREAASNEGNGRRNLRQAYNTNKREYNRQDSTREGVLEEGNGRNFEEVYDKREYRRLDSLNGSREVTLNEGNGRRNLRQVYNKNKREYNRQDSRNGLVEMGSREVAFSEGNGRRNLRHDDNKREYRRQDSSNGSKKMGLREVVFNEENGRKNIRQVYDKRGYGIQNGSDELKGSAKAEVYDLRFERDDRYEFRQEN